MPVYELQKSADLSLRIIASEAGILSNLANSIKNNFNPIKEFLASSASFTDIMIDKPDLELTREQQKLFSKINGTNFVRLSELPVGVMPNMKAKLTDLQPVVEDAIKRIKAFNTEIVTPYYIRLSTFVSNKDAKLSIKDETHIYKKLAQDRESVAKHNATYFSNKDGSGKSTVGDLIARSGDLDHVFDHVNRYRSEFREIHLDSIKDSIKGCVSLLDDIINSISDGTVTEVSPEVVKSLAHGAYEVALQAEFMTALAVVVLGYFGAADNLFSTLKQAEKIGKI